MTKYLRSSHYKCVLNGKKVNQIEIILVARLFQIGTFYDKKLLANSFWRDNLP